MMNVNYLKLYNTDQTNYDFVMDKIKSLKKIKFDYELAKVLSIEQSTLSERRKRNSLPFKEIVEFAANENISLDWLLLEENHEKGQIGSHLKHQAELLNELRIVKEKLSHEDIQTCTIKTQAMEPLLLLDDFLVVVKHCEPATHGDGIYSIKINNTEKIRRVHVLPGQKMKITADNWKEDTEIFDLNNHPDIEFIGKVVFFGRKVGNVK
jgi:hypothetical protein